MHPTLQASLEVNAHGSGLQRWENWRGGGIMVRGKVLTIVEPAVSINGCLN